MRGRQPRGEAAEDAYANLTDGILADSTANLSIPEARVASAAPAGPQTTAASRRRTIIRAPREDGRASRAEMKALHGGTERRAKWKK